MLSFSSASLCESVVRKSIVSSVRGFEDDGSPPAPLLQLSPVGSHSRTELRCCWAPPPVTEIVEMVAREPRRVSNSLSFIRWICTSRFRMSFACCVRTCASCVLRRNVSSRRDFAEDSEVRMVELKERV